MSTDATFDLMECVRLDMEELERQYPNAMISPGERARLREQRGLVTGLQGEHREILWGYRGRLAYAMLNINDLAPAKLA